MVLVGQSSSVEYMETVVLDGQTSSEECVWRLLATVGQTSSVE